MTAIKNMTIFDILFKETGIKNWKRVNAPGEIRYENEKEIIFVEYENDILSLIWEDGSIMTQFAKDLVF